MKIKIYFLLLLLTCCSDDVEYDLIISNATVLNVETGLKNKNQNILIKNGKIVNITHKIDNRCKEKYDAEGKLVSPGFIDTHIHPTDVFGDYAEAPLYLAEDAVEDYRNQLSREYLPYGITTALMMGHPENWLAPILKWNDSNPGYTDFLTCGGALISKEERKPYIGHFTVEGEKQAKEKVIEYYNRGIRHIKVYHRLQEPEFSAVMKTADSLRMKVYGHIGDYDPSKLNIRQTLEKGLKNYEHIATFPYSIIKDENEWEKFDTQYESVFGRADTMEKVLMMFLEAFRYIDENKKEESDQLIEKLAQCNTTFSTTTGLIYQQFKSSHYFTSVNSSLSEGQIKRSEENFRMMMKYLMKMADAGIQLRIATDSKDGGKVFLTELKILSEYGFSTEAIFKIATLNGAEALGLAEKTGTIENNKTANLIIWEQSPFDTPGNFFSKKLIIKNGILQNQ